MTEVTQEYMNILKKYGCSLIEGKIINKKGNDTKIFWNNILEAEDSLRSIGASNFEEVRKQLVDIFEDEVKIRSEV